MRHRIVLGLLIIAAGLGSLTGVRPAGAQADPVAEAAEELRRDPVVVDPDAERALTDEEADRLREHIRDIGTPVFVAVLPAGAGDAEEVVARLVDETGLSGTYAAVVGDAFRASSTRLPDADELATAAFQSAATDGTAAVLTRFVDELAAADGGTGADRGAVDDDPGAADDGGSPAWLLPAAVVGGGAGLLWWARRRRRRNEELRAARRAEVEMIRAELAVVADDVLRLEPEVALHPEARDDYDAAAERHRVASAAIDAAGDRVDPARLERVVAEARYAMARARARVEGREPPGPPDDLRRPGRHDEPPLDVDDDGAPVYAGGRSFYGDGWFGGGGGGGLFGGLLLGSMLGGWGWGGGWGGPVVIDHHDGDGGDAGGDGGDGGGWGDGGDFGGGDWGGGDFGGGDFGGGDW